MQMILTPADLPDQALIHAVKGRGILLSPEGHMTLPDPQPQAVLALAVAHYIISRVLITQGKYPILYILSIFVL